MTPPSLGELRAGAGRNGLRVVSVFAGAGGSAVGWVWAGYRLAWAHDRDELLRAALARNFPELRFEAPSAGEGPLAEVFRARSLAELDAASLLEAAGVQAGELDVLEGAPPAPRLEREADEEDLEEGAAEENPAAEEWTDELVAVFASLVAEVRPRAFVLEGDAALARGRARGYLRDARDALAAPGYRVAFRELETSWLGAPVSKKLLLGVGLREDLEVDPPFPAPVSPRGSVAEALPWVVGFRDRELSVRRPAPRLSAFALAEGVGTEVQRTTGPAGLRYRFGRVSLAEAKRLAGFPDDLVLAGDFTRQRRWLDTAVPPVVTYHVGRALEEVLR